MLCPCIFLTGKYEGGNFKISFPVLCLCYSLKLFSVLYLCYEILEHHVPGFLLNTNNIFSVAFRPGLDGRNNIFLCLGNIV